MPKSEVLLYSRSKFNATAILYKLAICKGKIYGIVLYEIAGYRTEERMAEERGTEENTDLHSFA